METREIDIERVAPTKRWAVGLTEHEYLNEFSRRNPTADAIPSYDLLDEWLYRPEPTYRHIDSINPDDYETELIGLPEEVEVAQKQAKKARKEESKDEVKINPRDQIFSCVCGREVKSKLGLASHQRHCDKALNQRT